MEDCLLDRCADACDGCAAECRAVLAADPDYIGAGKFSPRQVALLSCADVCKVTAAAVRERRDRLAEVCLWCADVCEGLLRESGALSESPTALEACRRSASLCRQAFESGERGTAPTQAAAEHEVFAVATADWSDDIRLATISRLLERVRLAFGMDVVFVSQFTNDRRVFRYVNASESAQQLLSVGGSDPLEESYCKRVVDGRLPEVIQNAQELPEANALPVTQAINLGGHLSVPIQLGSGGVFGTLCCFSQRPHPELEERDAVVLREVAAVLAKTIVEPRIAHRGT